MKIIKIHNCSECPYSEFYTINDPNQKPILKKGNMSYYGRMKTIKRYTCSHYDLKENGKNVGNGDIPDWCPLESDNSFDDMLEAGQEFKKKLGLTDKEIDKLLKILKREEDK